MAGKTFKQFYYGVCYYPEHWDARRHESDIARMAENGFNCVRLGEGAWSYWEPREGEYQFDLFDRVIDLCRKHGVQVVMGTPTYCAPAWVGNNYPEVLRWNFERIPMRHGSRRNFNYTSPKYLELSDKICTAMAEHYKDEKQIFAWQLDNEFNCHMDVSYAPSDTRAFRAWLKAKYRTIDRLNEAWGTKFWSQTYDDWDQIDLPHPTPTYMNPSQLLDETRFISDYVVRFAARQAAILRSANRNWIITHNALFTNVEGRKLTREALDIFSHDQYPLFCPEGDWAGASLNLLMSRSLSFPFGLLEQQSGPGGQMTYLQPTPRPGQMRLWAMQSVTHGAKLLEYFRWRTCPYGAEQHWHGLLDADDRDNRRLAEARQLGQELAVLPVEIFDAPVDRAVAVMRDFDNETNDRRINTYNKSGAAETWAIAATAARKHVPVDFVWADSDLTGYKLLIVPHLKIVDKVLVDKLTKWVQAGGNLVLTAQSGTKDKNCHIVAMPLPGLFRKLTGVEVQDWSTVPEKQERVARLDNGQTLPLITFVERLKPISATPIGYWIGGDTLLDEAPAVTVNRVGRGLVYYVGGYVVGDSAGILLDRLLSETQIEPIIIADPEIEVVSRRAGRRRWLFVLNHSNGIKHIRALAAGKELMTGQAVPKQGLQLQAYGIAVVEMPGSGRGKTG